LYKKNAPVIKAHFSCPDASSIYTDTTLKAYPSVIPVVYRYNTTGKDINLKSIWYYNCIPEIGMNGFWQ
jgi:hypothetical protein